MRQKRIPFVTPPSAWLAVLLLTTLGVILYANTLNAPFVFDDHHNITENPYIRITAFTPEQISQIQQGSAPNRPLATLTFALNYYFHQYQVTGYHVINILIHIITGLLVFFVAEQTLILCGKKRPRWIAFSAALLWLAHPLHTQSVTYIVQRMNVLAALFYLLALFCYILARKNQRIGGPSHKSVVFFIAAAVSSLLGLGSKEITVTLPLIIFFYEWFFFHGADLSWMKRRTPWLIGSVAFILAMGAIFIRGNLIDSILATYETRHFTLLERLLTQPGIVIFYISQIIDPHPSRLNPDHHFPLSHNLLSPGTTVLAIIAIAILFLAAIIAARKHRLFSFAIIWFFGNLALESSVIGLELIFEHRTYLPSVFFVIAATSGLFNCLKSKTLTWLVLVAGICLYGFWTIQRNQVWQNDVAFWKDCIDKSPQKSRPYNNLGVTYNYKKNYPAAIQAHQKALSLRRRQRGGDRLSLADSYGKLGVLYKNIGDCERALQYHRDALKIFNTVLGPDHLKIADSYNSLAMTYSQQGDVDAALTYHQKALAIRTKQLGPEHPETAETFHNLGVVYAQKGDYDKAIQLTQQALTIEQTSFRHDPQKIADGYFNLGAVCANKGAPRQALVYYQAALAIQERLLGEGHPRTIHSHNNLGRVHGTLENYQQALYHFQKAVDIIGAEDDATPLDITTLYANLAHAYYQTSHYRQAKTYYQKLLSEERDAPSRPDIAAIYNNLGTACHKMSDLTSAIAYYQRALDIKLRQPGKNHPDTAGTYNNLGALFYEKNDLENAQRCFREAHAIYRDTLGDAHPLTQQAATYISRLTPAK